MTRRLLIAVLAFVALVVTGATLAFAQPAQASSKPIGLSFDGVTFTDQLSASLFGGARIVPGTTVTRTFWVKNQTAMPGNLAVAVSGVTGPDADLIAGLSLRAVAGSTTGHTVPFASVNPCRSLLSDVLLPAGAIMQVDVRLTLSPSLAHAKKGQGSVGAFRIPVTLTSTDVPAPDGCAATPPVTPPDGEPTNPPVTPPPGTIGTAEISGSADGSVASGEGEHGALSGLSGRGNVRSLSIIPNTARLWQEMDVAWYVVALGFGGIFAWRRRRRDDREEAFA